MHRLLNRIAGSLAVLIFVVLLTACSDSSHSRDESVPAIDTANMDLTQEPGEDFYRYVNGGWLDSHPIPDDKSAYGSFDELDDLNNERLHLLVEELTTARAAVLSGNEQKIADFYAVGMDTATLEQQGFAPLQDYLERIDAIDAISGVQALLAEFQLYGIGGVMRFYATQDAKNSERMIGKFWQKKLPLPDISYYSDDSDHYQTIRRQYQEHIARMFELLDYQSATAQNAATVVLALESQLAAASNSRLENRDPNAIYHLMTVADLETLAPNYDWPQYFAVFDVAESGVFNVAQPDFVAAVSDMMVSVAVEDWKTLLRWQLLNFAAPYLSAEFVEKDFAFFSTTLRGQTEMKPRWQRVLAELELALGEALGEQYVARYFPPQSKQQVLEIVDDLKQAMARRIDSLSWMSAATKAQAQLKLSKVAVKIGYPDQWRDYSALQVGDESYLANVLQARVHNARYNLQQIGQPVDRQKWLMTPQTVNAYYSPPLNEIAFPAAILQPPFFDAAADLAVQYGSIGFVIGHEISHGFDDQGRYYDGDGNLNDWWSADDAEQFNQQRQLLVDHFNQLSVAIDGERLYVDGELTAGENIADVSGLTIAFAAYQSRIAELPEPELIDGFSDEQRFFISSAQVWRENIRDEWLAELLKADVHAPKQFRVNGALFNVPAFYEAFMIPATAPLARSDEQIPLFW